MQRFRKGIRILCIIMLWLFLLCYSASADNVVYTDGIDTLSISFNQCVPGNEYSILLVKGTNKTGPINSENLLFVDQLTADSDGNIYVAFVHPSFSNCTVLLGGTFKSSLTSPQLLGNYSPDIPEPEVTFTLPSMLENIENEAFSGCAYTHVYLGENVSSIGARAFSYSTQLVYIYIPDSTTNIADDAFEGCSDFIIGCHANSYAQQYAIEHSIHYRIVK